MTVEATSSSTTCSTTAVTSSAKSALAVRGEAKKAAPTAMDIPATRYVRMIILPVRIRRPGLDAAAAARERTVRVAETEGTKIFG
jgi:hypothetical protein